MPGIDYTIYFDSAHKKNDVARNYKAEIIELAAGSDSSDELRASSCVIDFDSPSDIYAPIRSKSASLTVLIEEAAHQTWLYALATAGPHEYMLKIYRDIGGYALIFRGYLQFDELIFENRDYPYAATLTASDGLGLLAEFEYKTVGDAVLLGTYSVIGHIQQIFASSYLAELFTAGETMLAVSSAYFEDTHNTTQDGMSQAYLSHRAFTSYETTEHDVIVVVDLPDPLDDISITTKKTEIVSAEFKTCAEVLTIILEAFFCEIYQKDGYYHIVNKRNYQAVGWDIYKYSKSAFIVKTTENNSIAINQDNIVIMGGSWRFNHPVKKVYIRQQLQAQKNLISGLSWDFNENFEISNIANIDNRGQAVLDITLVWDLRSIDTTAAGFPASHFYRFRVKVVVGSKYLKRSFVEFDPDGKPTFEEMTWSASLSYVDVICYDPDPSRWFGNFTYIEKFTTPEVPENGNLSMDVDLYEIMLPFSGTYPLNGIFSQSFFGTSYNYTYSWQWFNYKSTVRVVSKNEEVNINSRVYNEYEVLVNQRYSEIKKIETPIGDDPGGNSDYALKNWDGGVIFTDTESWTIWGSGTSKELLQHVADDMAAFKGRVGWIKNIELLTLTDYIDYTHQLGYNGKVYRVLSGTFDCGTETFTGQLIERFAAGSASTTKKKIKKGGLHPIFDDFINATIGDPDTAATPNINGAEFYGSDVLPGLEYTNTDIEFNDPAIYSDTWFNLNYDVMKNGVKMAHKAAGITHANHYRVKSTDKNTLEFFRLNAVDHIIIRKNIIK